MKKGLTLLVFIMDRSGSMSRIITDSIGGFNSLIESQKKDALENGNEVRVSLTIFNNSVDIIYNNVDINEVSLLNERVFNASGSTSLNDAIGITVDSVGRELSKLPEEERPEKVLVSIITDGEENTSKEYTNAQIKELISHQESVYNWTFNFIGANIDSFQEGNSRGVKAMNSANYSATCDGVTNMFDGLSNYTLSFRNSTCDVDTDLSAFIKK